jgi:hypothetical protein
MVGTKATNIAPFFLCGVTGFAKALRVVLDVNSKHGFDGSLYSYKSQKQVCSSHPCVRNNKGSMVTFGRVNLYG